MRARQTLASAIDLKRKLIEALRHRTAMLGGVLAYANVKSQGATITATFPSTIFQAVV